MVDAIGRNVGSAHDEQPVEPRRPGLDRKLPFHEAMLLGYKAALCSPPDNGLILKSYIRNLTQDADGKLARITAADLKDRKAFPDWNPIYTEPQRYNVWLTEAGLDLHVNKDNGRALVAGCSMGKAMIGRG